MNLSDFLEKASFYELRPVFDSLRRTIPKSDVELLKLLLQLAAQPKVGRYKTSLGEYLDEIHIPKYKSKIIWHFSEHILNGHNHKCCEKYFKYFISFTFYKGFIDLSDIYKYRLVIKSKNFNNSSGQWKIEAIIQQADVTILGNLEQIRVKIHQNSNHLLLYPKRKLLH